jgi:hypothetical protein
MAAVERRPYLYISRASVTPSKRLARIGQVLAGVHRYNSGQLQMNNDARAVGKVAYQGARNHDSSSGVRARWISWALPN